LGFIEGGIVLVLGAEFGDGGHEARLGVLWESGRARGRLGEVGADFVRSGLVMPGGGVLLGVRSD
jgi:hypothetical protein